MPRPAPDALLRTLPWLLRPLVRLLVRAGVTFPAVADELRRLFVEVAADELERAGERVTASRLTLASGVHRKEVARLLPLIGAASPVPEPPRRVSLTTELVSRWLGAAAYRDANGAPRVLPRTAPADEPSFETLVRDLTTDMRARTVLDDWLARGLVTLDASGDVRLVEREALPATDAEGRLFFFSRNLHDHLAAASANLDQGQSVFPDASVHYDRLSPAQAAALEAVAREAAAGLLRQVNRAAQDIVAAAPEASGTSRVNLGVYLFSAAEDGSHP